MLDLGAVRWRPGTVSYTMKNSGLLRARTGTPYLSVRYPCINERLPGERRGLTPRLESSFHERDRRSKEPCVGQIQMAVRMLEKKDVYTRGHSQRVSRYAVKTAMLLGFSGSPLDQIRLGGELHDIGKIGTRDSVLQKPGPLTSVEFEEIKKHVTEGEEILEPLRRENPLVLQIVRSHHERLDGSGFPDGLKGEAIPLPARIVAVVDAFDAMTTNRSYRTPRPPGEALQELLQFAGVLFDSAVVAAFQQAFPDPQKLPISV
jgi:putative nucleotidyltransferase with HDIG domain